MCHVDLRKGDKMNELEASVTARDDAGQRKTEAADYVGAKGRVR